MIAARRWEKFAAYPYQRVPISDTDWCMAVEAKREVDDKDVDHYLKRIKLIREHPPLEVVGKKLLGAITGGVCA